MATIPVLTTERLILRPFREVDAPAVARILSTPRNQQPYPVDAARSWIRQHNAWADQGLHLQWGITLPDGTPIGMVSLDLGKEPPQGNLGYLLDAAAWRQGYATEAVRAVIAYGFDVLKLPRIEAKCFATNSASIRVLEKSGLVYESTPAAYADKRHNIVCYAIANPSAVESRP